MIQKLGIWQDGCANFLSGASHLVQIQGERERQMGLTFSIEIEHMRNFVLQIWIYLTILNSDLIFL